jgi:hypothetical protein
VKERRASCEERGLEEKIENENKTATPRIPKDRGVSEVTARSGAE